MERMKNGHGQTGLSFLPGGSIESRLLGSMLIMFKQIVLFCTFMLSNHCHLIVFLAPTEGKGKGKGKDKGKAGSKGKSSSASLGSPAEMAFMVDAAVHNLLFFLSEILSCTYWPVIHSELRYSLKLKMMMMIRSGERGGKEPGLFPATQRSVPWLRCSLCCCLLCCSSILSFAHSLIDWLSLPSPLSTGYARCSSIEMLLVPWNICWTKAPALLWWIVPADTTGHLPWVLCYGRFWQLLGGKKIHVKNYDDYCWWWSWQWMNWCVRLLDMMPCCTSHHCRKTMTGSKFASKPSECLRIVRWICALSSISPACKCVPQHLL